MRNNQYMYLNRETYRPHPLPSPPIPSPFCLTKEKKKILLSEPLVYLHTYIRMYLFIGLTSSYCIVLYYIMHSYVDSRTGLGGEVRGLFFPSQIM